MTLFLVIMTYLLMQVIINHRFIYGHCVRFSFLYVVMKTIMQKILGLCACAAVLCVPVRAYAGSGHNHMVSHFPPAITEKYVDASVGHKRMIMIYTSWCPYCQLKMPAVIKLEQIKPGSVIAISADKNYARFGSYIQSFDTIPFRVILNKGREEDLYAHLKKFGISEGHGYPNIILMDENNHVVAEGNLSMETVANYILRSPKDAGADKPSD